MNPSCIDLVLQHVLLIIDKPTLLFAWEGGLQMWCRNCNIETNEKTAQFVGSLLKKILR